jgi:hypothetical protein
MALRWAVLAAALALSGPALADDFVVRTAGAATIIAVDMDSVSKAGRYRSGWTYELYRERNPFIGQRTQITGVLLEADCKTLLFRRLKVVHYLKSGRALSHMGPERTWTDALRGSNTDLTMREICHATDPAWARRKASSVFELYGQVWK